MTTRDARLKLLIDDLGGDRAKFEAGWDGETPIARYAAIAREEFDGSYGAGTIFCSDSLDDCLEELADEVLAGRDPDGVYDLDTGHKLEIRVRVIVTTRPGETNLTYNPLQEDA